MTDEQLLHDLLFNMTRTANPAPAPKRIDLYTDHYIFTVRIGKDHSATVIIDRDDFYELLNRRAGEGE